MSVCVGKERMCDESRGESRDGEEVQKWSERERDRERDPHRFVTTAECDALVSPRALGQPRPRALNLPIIVLSQPPVSSKQLKVQLVAGHGARALGAGWH